MNMKNISQSKTKNYISDFDCEVKKLESEYKKKK